MNRYLKIIILGGAILAAASGLPANAAGPGQGTVYTVATLNP